MSASPNRDALFDTANISLCVENGFFNQLKYAWRKNYGTLVRSRNYLSNLS